MKRKVYLLIVFVGGSGVSSMERIYVQNLVSHFDPGLIPQGWGSNSHMPRFKSQLDECPIPKKAQIPARVCRSLSQMFLGYIREYMYIPYTYI